MSLVVYLREFVNERLTAAAEEIFGVFQNTIVEYEEEIDRQRRLLEGYSCPDMKLQKIGVYKLYFLMKHIKISNIVHP